jgi:amino acid adenylation domain-containing protein
LAVCGTVVREEKRVGIMKPSVGRSFVGNEPRTDGVGQGSVGFPASFAQERLWFLDQLEPDSPVYNVSQVLRIEGALNVRALEGSLNEIVKRHGVLRTTFVEEEGQPLQGVAPTLGVPLPLVDLGKMEDADREVEARQLVNEEVRRPFDLSRGPLIRATLLRLDEMQHILILVVHHIIFDEWSLAVFFRELSVLYEALSAERRSKMGDLPFQYADYAAWQRQQLQGEALNEQLAYWKEKLAGSVPSLDLPADRPRLTTRTDRGGTEKLVGPRTSLDAIKALCREERVTMFMALLAAFDVLLYRYTGQEDILVGTPIANRDRVELEGLVGFFLNTLVLRTNLSGEPTFRELLGQVREVCLEAYTYQDLPFERLVEELRPARDLSHSPLFQAMFVHTPPTEPLRLAGLTVSRVEARNGRSKFDLTLFVNEEPAGLAAAIEYSTDLFDAVTIQRMLGHYQTLLASIVADPDRPIGSLQILTEAERQQLLVEWNDTQTGYQGDPCVHQLFEAQVERTPDAIAAESQRRQLTYRELNKRSNQLAQWLRWQGVGPDVLVGICVERSVKMLVGVLGILKAGGACVPLDPTYPLKRLAFMLEDMAVPVLLTEERLKDTFPEYAGLLVRLDTDWRTISEASDENPEGHALGANLVYVLYTSGSTGRPKGVALPHSALANLIAWQLQNTTVPGVTRMLQYSPLSFDASFTDIFMAVCAGSTLVIMPESARREMTELAGFIASHGCNRLNLSSVVLQHLSEVHDAWDLAPLGVEEVISTADQLRVTPSLRKLFGQMPDCTLQNQYGPTETHVVTALTLKGPSSDWPILPTVGRPISNTQIYVLDDYLQPVPIGVAGKLYIGGMCLARGYLKRPRLTAERFIPDPLSTDPGARMYVTGDLARYLSDGDIEFLGRVDHQVKIRGYRAEPGEVEAVLSRNPSVRQVVVAAKADEPSGEPCGDRRLVAYIVPNEGPPLTTTELHGFAKERLPEYLVPSAFVMLDALPLTPSGKVDRLALPTPDRTRPDLRDRYVAPRTPVEEALAGIWSGVLNVDLVGVHDDFFELGGHSLLATRVVSRIRDALHVELPLRRMFETPTVAQLAVAIEQHRGTVRSVRSPIEPVSREGYRIG